MAAKQKATAKKAMGGGVQPMHKAMAQGKDAMAAQRAVAGSSKK